MGKASRDKGKRGEREWAAFCRGQGYDDCRRTAQYCGQSGDAADITGLPGIHNEVKRVERLDLYGAMAQAVRDSTGSGKLPIVAHRRNNCGWLVTMRAEDWFDLYRDWVATREVK